MFGTSSFLLLLGVLASASCSESLLKGEITFMESKEVAEIHPLSEEPKVANIKNNLFEFVVIPEPESCAPLDKSRFTREQGRAPVLVVMELPATQPLACGMSHKIARIKEAGAYGFIIVTDDKTVLINHCKMYDSNNFFTGVMTSANFQVLQGQMVHPLFGSLTISPKDSNAKIIEVWTSSLNPASYDNLILLNNVLDKLPTLRREAELRPRIALLGCTHGDNAKICSKGDYVASCGCKGEFCSPEAHEKTPDILVEEDIRQLLIFRQYSTKYFQYLRLFRDQCLPNYLHSRYPKDCAINLMNKIDIDALSINTAIESFLDRCSNDDQLDVVSKTELYSTLETDKNAFSSYGRYPLLLFNKQILEYKNEEDLAGQFCRRLSLEDEGCFDVSSTQVRTMTGTLFYILLVVVLVSIGAGVVYFYRKKLKRDMNKEIKMQVSTAVEHYFALTDVK